MRNFVFNDDDRLRLGNFLNNLRFYFEGSAKSCPTIWASIHCDFYLTIRCWKRSRYTFMSDLLTGFSMVVLILILFTIAAMP